MTWVNWVKFWLLNSKARLHSRLEQHDLPPTFFDDKRAQKLNEKRLRKRHQIRDMECKLEKNSKIHTLKSWHET